MTPPAPSRPEGGLPPAHGAGARPNAVPAAANGRRRARPVGRFPSAPDEREWLIASIGYLAAALPVGALRRVHALVVEFEREQEGTTP